MGVWSNLIHFFTSCTHRQQHPRYSVQLRLLSSLPLFIMLLSSSSVTLSSMVDITEVLPNRFGSFNFTELEEVKYAVELLRVPLPDIEHESNVAGTEPGEDKSGLEADSNEPQYLILVSKYGQKYSCQLPWLQGESEPSQVEDKELNVTSLLLPLTKQPCLLKTVGWWTYEYCHGKVIRQYHMEAGKVVGKIIWLGYYDNETVWDTAQIERVQNIIDSMKSNLGKNEYPAAYHSASYVNGTICDKTGNLRVARVKLYCSASREDGLLDVIEHETCNYTITIQTSLLCQHSFFNFMKRGKTQTLSCSPLVSREEFQRYKEEQAHKLQEESSDAISVMADKNVNKYEDGGSSKYQTTRDRFMALLYQSPNTVTGTGHNNKAHNQGYQSLPISESPLTDSSTHSQEVSDKQRDFLDDIETVEEAVDVLYSRLMEALDNQGNTDRVSTLLKRSIQENYKKQKSLVQKTIHGLKTGTEKEPQVADSTRDSKVQEKTPDEDESEGRQASRHLDAYELQQGTETHESHDEHTEEDYQSKDISPHLLEQLKSVLDGKLETMDEEEIKQLIEDSYTEDSEDPLAGKLVEEAFRDELQEKLQRMGVGSDVKVKVFTLPASVSDKLIGDSEEDADSADDSKSSEKPSTIKVISLRLLGDGDHGRTSEDKDPRYSLEERLTPEQQRVKELESNYDHVWDENNAQRKRNPS